MTGQAHDPDAVLAQYKDGPAQLQTALAGLSEAALDATPDAKNWSIRQLVHHIVDGDDIWKTFIKIALGNSEATFELQWYWDIPQTTWAKSWAYATREIEPSLALFRANRRHVVQLVQEIPDAWERSLTIKWPHGDLQQVTVGWVIEMQFRHVAGHVEDIQKIRKMHGL
jgi:uncharacterized damage-inducible protein DinB